MQKGETKVEFRASYWITAERRGEEGKMKIYNKKRSKKGDRRSSKHTAHTDTHDISQHNPFVSTSYHIFSKRKKNQTKIANRNITQMKFTNIRAYYRPRKLLSLSLVNHHDLLRRDGVTVTILSGLSLHLSGLVRSKRQSE